MVDRLKQPRIRVKQKTTRIIAKSAQNAKKIFNETLNTVAASVSEIGNPLSENCGTQNRRDLQTSVSGEASARDRTVCILDRTLSSRCRYTQANKSTAPSLYGTSRDRCRNSDRCQISRSRSGSDEIQTGSLLGSLSNDLSSRSRACRAVTGKCIARSIVVCDADRTLSNFADAVSADRDDSEVIDTEKYPEIVGDVLFCLIEAELNICRGDRCIWRQIGRFCRIRVPAADLHKGLKCC